MSPAVHKAVAVRITPSVDGSATRPEPQGHKPAIARNRRVLPVPGAPTMTTRSPSAICTYCSLSMVQPEGVAISRFSKVTLLPGTLTVRAYKLRARRG